MVTRKYFSIEQAKPVVARELLKLLESKLEELKRRNVKPSKVSFKPSQIYSTVLLRLGLNPGRKRCGISHPLFQTVRALLEEAGVNYVAELRSKGRFAVVLSYDDLVRFVEYLRRLVSSQSEGNSTLCFQEGSA